MKVGSVSATSFPETNLVKNNAYCNNVTEECFERYEIYVIKKLSKIV